MHPHQRARRAWRHRRPAQQRRLAHPAGFRAGQPAAPDRWPAPDAQPGAVAAREPAAGSPPPGTQQQNSAAAQVLALINQTRAQAGLPPYEVDPNLMASALGHDLRMEDGCGLSHQCPHEPDLGARETAAGVHWTSAGENIGEGRLATNSPEITSIALSLTRADAEREPAQRRAPSEPAQPLVHVYRHRGDRR